MFQKLHGLKAVNPSSHCLWCAVQLQEQEAILEIAEEEVKRRMFKARNRHIEYSKADYHGQSVETSIKMLYQKLTHLKSNPDPGV
jgi:hypothetical protein